MSEKKLAKLFAQVQYLGKKDDIRSKDYALGVYTRLCLELQDVESTSQSD